jgi:hypothetical protein
VHSQLPANVRASTAGQQSRAPPAELALYTRDAGVEFAGFALALDGDPLDI